MMRFSNLLCCLFFLFSNHLYAQVQVPVFGRITPLNGYLREIQGENLPYFSAYPSFANVSLLTRCTDGKKTIAWETDTLPAQTDGGYIYFRWIAAHSSGTSKADRHFDLAINGKPVLTFATRMKKHEPFWTFAAPDSTAVVFETLTEDGVADLHGRMYLRVPAGKYPSGQPLRIEVTGQAEGSPDWYMTFKYRFEEKITLTPYPLLSQDNGQRAQSLFIKIDHVGDAAELRLSSENGQSLRFSVHYGYNLIEAKVPAVTEPTPMVLDVEIPGYWKSSERLVLQPVTLRTVWLIHHSHNDIGYSHLQEEVEQIQHKNILDALHMIRKTRRQSWEARFRWNMESLWAVENFMRLATPEQKSDFIHAVRQGSIALSGIYTHVLTGLCRPDEIMHLTAYAQRLRDEYGFDIPSIMITDIPGFSWSLVPALAKNGIRYFSDGPNYMSGLPDGGDRVGHSNRNWGDRPFYWVGPGGTDKILLWMAGQGYSAWHSLKPGDIFTRGKEKIGQYMQDLQDQDYSYEMVQWRYNIGADNGMVDTTLSDFVQQWNNVYTSPRLVIGNVHEMFRTFEERYGKSLPAYSGDFSPYWEDGAMSSAYETGLNLQTSEKLQQLSLLATLAAPKAIKAREWYEAWRQVILFSEHTWGAYNSVSDPDAPFAVHQWAYKQRFATEAARQTAAILQKIARALGKPDGRTLAVFNTTSSERSELASWSEALPAGMRIADDKGQPVPFQRLSSGETVFLAEKIPALGCRVFHLEPGEPPVLDNRFQWDEQAAKLSNEQITVQLHPDNGSIVGLANRRSAGDGYVNNAAGLGLNTYYYVDGYDPSNAVPNSEAVIRVKEPGPLVFTLEIDSKAPGCLAHTAEISLQRDRTEVWISNTLNKKRVRSKEAVHFAFPFRLPDAVVRYDLGWGYTSAEIGQLPGANKDFLTIGRWIDVSNQKKGITIVQRETPLFEVGAMVDERRNIAGLKTWREHTPTGPALYAYAMNNYWHTNYKADQEGVAAFHYLLAPHGLFHDADAYRTAINYTQPLICLPVPAAYKGKTGLRNSNPVILVATATPEANGFSLRLFNTSAAPQTTELEFPGGRIARVKWGGQMLEPVNGKYTVQLPGMANETLQVWK